MQHYQDKAECLAELETKFDVTRLAIDGVSIWPLIRAKLWFQLAHRVGQPKPQPQPASEPLVSAIAARTGDRLRSLKRKIGIEIRRPAAYWRFLQEISSLPRSGETDLLLLSRPEDASDRCRGHIYDRHIDPLLEIASGLGLRCLKLRVRLQIESEILEPHQFVWPPQFFELTDFRQAFQGNAYQAFKQTRVTFFKEFLLLLQDIVGEDWSRVSLEEASLVRKFRELFLLKEGLKVILANISPRAVFLVCYYSFFPGFAISWACRELGIPSVDLQHGQQGKYHGMYSHWTRFPDEGYKMLPDYFWNWGQTSKQHIEQWHPYSFSAHRPLVGGNLWLAKWLHSDVGAFEYDFQSFLGEIEKKEKLILLALQPRSEPIEEFVLEAMASTTDKWLWLVRLHPRDKARQGDLEQQFRTRGIHNFEIEQSTNAPLYSLLKRVRLNLTAWSSVCIEALYFQVPTAIVHPIGAELFADYIQAGAFRYVSDRDSLLSWLANTSLTESATGRFETNYIETSRDAAERALQSILAAGPSFH